MTSRSHRDTACDETNTALNIPHLSLYIHCNDAVRSSVRLGTKRPGTRSIKAPVVPRTRSTGFLTRTVGVCDIGKKDISILLGIFSITIIRRYFAECADIWQPYTAAVYDILHILCAQITSVINHLFI